MCPGRVPERPRSAWRATKGAPGCRKEHPGAPEWTPRGRKSMPSGLWKPKNSKFVRQLTQQSVSECFFVDFLSFRKVAEPSKVPRLSAKTEVRPFALWVALEPRTMTQIRQFCEPLDVKFVLERRCWDVRLALERRFQGPLHVKLAGAGAGARQVGRGRGRGRQGRR